MISSTRSRSATAAIRSATAPISVKALKRSGVRDKASIARAMAMRLRSWRSRSRALRLENWVTWR